MKPCMDPLPASAAGAPPATSSATPGFGAFGFLLFVPIDPGQCGGGHELRAVELGNGLRPEGHPIVQLFQRMQSLIEGREITCADGRLRFGRRIRFVDFQRLLQAVAISHVIRDS